MKCIRFMCRLFLILGCNVNGYRDVLTHSFQTRGASVLDHPKMLGACNNSAAVDKFYATVDAFVIAGSLVRGHETRDLSMKLPSKRAQIDVDPAANGRTYACDLFVCAD